MEGMGGGVTCCVTRLLRKRGSGYGAHTSERPTAPNDLSPMATLRGMSASPSSQSERCVHTDTSVSDIHRLRLGIADLQVAYYSFSQVLAHYSLQLVADDTRPSQTYHL